MTASILRRYTFNQEIEYRDGQLTTEKFLVPDRTGRIELEFDFKPVVGELEKSKTILKKEIESNDQLKSQLSTAEASKEDFLNDFLPLRNHINLSIFDSRDKFRGRWDQPSHQGEKVTIAISKEDTTNGFIGGHFPRGDWKVFIEKHHLISENVRVNLSIKLFERATSLSSYRGELHVHSNHSDGKLSPAEIAEKMREDQKDYFALTDHNNVSGWKGSPQKSKDKPVLLPGLEFSTFNGHALALGIKTFVKWHQLFNDNISLNETIDFVHDQGGMFGIAHPFELDAPFCVGCRWGFTKFDWSKIDFMEIWTRNWSDNDVKNDKAYKLWQHKIKEGYRVTAIASNDLHDFEILTRDKLYPCTYIIAASGQAEDLLNSIWEGRVYISSRPEINFSFVREEDHGNGITEYIIGDYVDNPKKGKFKVEINNVNGSFQLKLKDEKGTFVKENIACKNDKVYKEFEVNCQNKSLVYLEMIENQELVAITNPIYFNSIRDNNQ